MAGGGNAGIDTCWYNKLGERNTGAVPVTYEVKKLADILPIVTGQAKDAAEA